MEFEVSVYENDSIDGSDAWLQDIVEFDDSSVPFHLSTERLRTAYFGSVISGERVENLAFARNQCFLPVNLDTFDKVVFIEPDVVYNVEEMNPDPFMEQVGSYGLPWNEIIDKPLPVNENELI